MAGEPEAGTQPEPDFDVEAVDALPVEDLDKLKRGEIEPPKRKTEAAPQEGKSEPSDDLDGVDPKSETVPYGKFHQTLERRKAAEARAQENERRAAEAEARANVAFQRMAELMEAAKPPREEQEAPADPGQEPDAVDAPYDWITWKQQKDRFEAHRQNEHHQRQTQQQQQQTQFTRAVVADVERFKATTPDYLEARAFYWNSRGPELMALGYSQQDAEQIIARDEHQIASLALQRRMSPAETLYKIAHTRGYRRDEQQTNGHDQPRDANGKFTAAAAAMDKREATKQAAKSLGGSGGPGEMGMPTPQEIADMEPAEFETFKKKWGSISNYLARQ